MFNLSMYEATDIALTKDEKTGFFFLFYES